MNTFLAQFNVLIQNVNTIVRRFKRVPLLLVLVWVIALWWGERIVFEKSATSCAWNRWENWPAGSNPHHVLYIADPQLVDPHTYPGRPWPLSTLTVLYTDLYLKRSYRYLLDTIQPDTTLFLGDLFDGGREWATARYKSPEARYQDYGTKFWLKEYSRFMNIFIRGWHDRGMAIQPSSGGRRLIASLPGNHDLGFAAGIDDHVKSRFDAHFGPLNRIDVLGNHTFVSIDSVSLSAMDQVDPVSGSSGAGDGSAAATKSSEIWTPVEQFLNEAKSVRSRRIRQECRVLDALTNDTLLFPEPAKFVHEAYSLSNLPSTEQRPREDEPSIPSFHFPTIILSHVPFFRAAETSCGPLRERGHSISLSAGYQYQNVLTPLISRDIVEHLDAEQITMIYSGDDHDYCEVEHGEFTGRIREITVKSMSWAMGIRQPGVQLASLWNPIDLVSIAKGQASESSMPRGTVQNHLCLLPDQLGIFIHYAQLLGITLIILIVRAIRHDPLQKIEKSLTPLLPMSRKVTPPSSPSLKGNTYPIRSNSIPTSTSSSSTSSSSSSASLDPNSISTAARTSKLGGYGNLPASTRSSSPGPGSGFGQSTDDWGMPASQLGVGDRTQTGYFAGAHHLHTRRRPRTKLQEFKCSVGEVAVPVLVFYAWLLWNG